MASLHHHPCGETTRGEHPQRACFVLSLIWGRKSRIQKELYKSQFCFGPPWPILIIYRLENTRLGLKTPNLDSVRQTNFKSAPLEHGWTFSTSQQMCLCGKQTIYMWKTDISHPVVRPIHFRPISPTIASRNFRTPANRSATPYYIDIFPLKFKLNSRESSYRIFRSKTSPNTHFQGGGNSEYFIKIYYYFSNLNEPSC